MEGPLCVCPFILHCIGVGLRCQRWTGKSPHVGGLKHVRIRLLFYVFWGQLGHWASSEHPRVFGCEVQVGKVGATEPSSLQGRAGAAGGRIETWQSALEPTHQTPHAHRQS